MKICCFLAFALSCQTLFADTAKVYVAEIHGGSVSIINVDDNSVQTLSGFSSPRVVKINPEGTLGYVGEDSNQIHIFETATNLIKASINVKHPVALAISSDGNNAYVASSDDTLAMIDLTNNSIQSILTGFNNVQDVKANPQNQFVYVTNAGNNTVSVIDRNQGAIVATIHGFNTPLGITINQEGTLAFVTNAHGDSLSIVSLVENSIIETIQGLTDPKYIAVSPQGTAVYVASFGDNSIKILSLDQASGFPFGELIGSIPVFQPAAIAITPDGEYLYASSGSSTVVKIRLADKVIINTTNGFQNPTNLAVAIAKQPCLFVDGCHGFKEHLGQKQFFNKISWNAAPGSPSKYQIYRDSELTVLAGETTDLVFKENVSEHERTVYYVVAQYPNGFTMTVGDVLVVPCRHCHAKNQGAD